ncbi:hypothetical protein Sste5344_003395 [Sporothrix stenoceras]
MRRPPTFAKRYFWFTHRWFVALTTASSNHPVVVTTPVFNVSDVLPDMFTIPSPEQDVAERLFEAEKLSSTLVSAPMDFR